MIKTYTRYLFIGLFGILCCAALVEAQPVVCVQPSPIVLSSAVSATARINVTVSVSNWTEPITFTNISVIAPQGSGPILSFSLIAPNQTTLSSGEELAISVVWRAPGSEIAPQHAFLYLESGEYSLKVPIAGVVFLKNEEPSLQWVLDAFGISVNVGDDDPSTMALNSKRELAASPRLGPDEIVSPLFVKANDGPVQTVTLASWAYEAFNPVSTFGWYFPTKNVTSIPKINYLFNITNTPLSNAKMMIPPVVGMTTFDPDAANAGAPIAFGISVSYPFFRRDLFSEDFRNTFRNALPHHIRSYPLYLNSSSGERQRVPNAIVLTSEDVTDPIDFNDQIVVIFNIKPANSSANPTGPVMPISLSPIQPDLRFCQILPIPLPVAPPQDVSPPVSSPFSPAPAPTGGHVPSSDSALFHISLFAYFVIVVNWAVTISRLC